MGLSDCKLIHIPPIENARGKIGVVEAQEHIPFDIQRAYFLYDMPPGAVRGGHAHRNLQQVMIAVSGGLDVIVDDSEQSKRFTLDRPDCGLVISKMIWRTLVNIQPSTVCVVLASLPYDEGDYLRDYDAFIHSARDRS